MGGRLQFRGADADNEEQGVSWQYYEYQGYLLIILNIEGNFAVFLYGSILAKTLNIASRILKYL